MWTVNGHLGHLVFLVTDPTLYHQQLRIAAWDYFNPHRQRACGRVDVTQDVYTLDWEEQ